MTWIGMLRATRLGFINFGRNFWLSVAATLVVMLMLFTVSVFVVQSLVIYQTTEAIKQKIDLVVYFEEGATEEQIETLRQLVANRLDVASVTYVSKEQAYEIFQARPGSEQIKNLVTPEDNPLPRSLEVKANDPARLETIAAFFQSPDYDPLIRRISYQENKRLIDDLVATARTTRRNGLILSALFLAIATLMVFNTARIVTHARREEIEIMRLVGSTETFIRWPFLIEGILYGLLAALMSMGVLYVFLYYDLASATPLVSVTGALGADMLSFYRDYFWWVLVTQLVFGVLVSVAATSLAIWKHVRL